MEPAIIDGLVRRLVQDPQDSEALLAAHAAGTEDPRSYAMLLERVGTLTEDAGYASHWLSEAASVWSITIGDAHRAARVLMQAIDRDPTQRVAADRLAALYRDKGDTKGLVALLERRAKALAPLLAESEEVREDLLALHDELAKIWTESFGQPRKALEHYKRIAEIDPTSALAVYNVRETLKDLGRTAEAAELYADEIALEPDPSRKVALLRDEAVVRRSLSDLAAATRALAKARLIDPNDSALQYEFASTVVEQVAAGEEVTPPIRSAAAELLVGLAEQFDGEHGLAYAAAALDIIPSHDRALELFSYYARALQREGELPARQAAYLEAAPDGEIAAQVRIQLADAYEAARDLESAESVLSPLEASGDEGIAARLTALREQIAGPAVVAPSHRSSRSTVTAHHATAEPEQADPGDAPTMRPPADSGKTATGTPERKSGSDTAVVKDTISILVNEARTLGESGDVVQALTAMRTVLKQTPSHKEALAWTVARLTELGQWADLRDVLRDALNATPRTDATREDRKTQLETLARVSSRELADQSTALAAYDELVDLDPTDEAVLNERDTLLETAGRYADLVEALESRRDQPGSDAVALTTRIAEIYETRLDDRVGAARERNHLSRLEPTEGRISAAVAAFEKADDVPGAIGCIGEHLHTAEPSLRAKLLGHCAELYERIGNPARAAECYRDAGAISRDAALLRKAEDAAVAAKNWSLAADLASKVAEASADDEAKAECLVREADHLERAGASEQSLARLEDAYQLAKSDIIADRLAARYDALGASRALAKLARTRAERATSSDEKISWLRKAARLYADKAGDQETCREIELAIVAIKPDAEASEWLLEDAKRRGDHAAVTRELERLFDSAETKEAKTKIALLQAAHFSDDLEDSDAAVARYEYILKELDPSCRQALRSLASILEARGDVLDGAGAVARELELSAGGEESHALATRLARLGDQSGDIDLTIVALERLTKEDPDDFDALDRLCSAYEKAEQWADLARVLPQRIDAEADESEIAQLTMKLASLKAEQLDDLTGALAVLEEAARKGDRAARARFIELAEKHGRDDRIPAALEAWWFAEKPSPDRSKWLRVAFEKRKERGEISLKLGIDLLRTRNPDRSLALQMEPVALAAKDADAVGIVEDALCRSLQGAALSAELVRQAEARVAAGLGRPEAVAHAERGAANVPAAEIPEYLEKLAAIAGSADAACAVYERHAERSRTPAERTRGFVGAARIAGAAGDLERATRAIRSSLVPPLTAELLDSVEKAVATSEPKATRELLMKALATAIAEAAAAIEEAGKTQATLFRRAGAIAQRELSDKDLAFTLLSKAIHAHVDTALLEEIEQMTDTTAAAAAVAAIYTDVLASAPPPVARLLHESRGRLRRDRLGELEGAAEDFRKTHDLAPNDLHVIDQLSSLLETLGDHRALVHILEEQILRSKDLRARAELARRIARLWDAKIGDAREAADAWRRVLRMAQGDAEATEGLERSKLTIRAQSEAAVRAALPSVTELPKDKDDEEKAPASREQERVPTEEEAASTKPAPLAAGDSEQDVGAPKASMTAETAMPAPVMEHEPASPAGHMVSDTTPPDGAALEPAAPELPPENHDPDTATEMRAAPAVAAEEPLDDDSAMDGPPAEATRSVGDTAPPTADSTTQQAALASDDLEAAIPAPGESNVVIADDLAEMIDDEDDDAEPLDLVTGEHEDLSATSVHTSAPPEQELESSDPTPERKTSKSRPPPLPEP